MKANRAVLIAVAALLGGCNGGMDERGDFTILLKSFSNADHAKLAKYYRDQTESSAGWDGLYVVHGDGQSDLFWGKYATVEDAQDNLRQAKAWKAPAGGETIYNLAMVVPVPGRDIGPSRWNLRNQKGTWTVAVGKFFNMPAEGLHMAYTDRREKAVAFCQKLRDAGEEAYFIHEPARSFVTIGLFPASAYLEDPHDLNTPPRIVDPRIRNIMAKHPELIVNDLKEMTYVPIQGTDKKYQLVTASFVMKVPREDADGGSFYNP